MPNWGLVDDTSSYIAYSGSWARQTGSTRQWNGDIHSTSQSGATATFRFRGTGIQVYGTVPAGSGVSRSRYTIDGSATSVDRRCSSNAVYNDLLFERRDLSAGDHTLVISNAGSEADFQLDKIEWLPVADDPASETPLAPAPADAPRPTNTPTTSPTPATTPPNGNNNPPPSVPETVTVTSGVVTSPDANSPGGSTTTRTGTGTITGTAMNVQTIVSIYMSNGTPVTLTSTASASISTLSTAVVVSTDSNGQEVGGHTVIVMVSDGHTITQGVTPTDAPRGVQQTGASSGLSKAALGGIIAGLLVLAFIFVFLFIWLFRRVRRRRQLLNDPISNSENSPPMGETSGGRNGLYPFSLTTAGRAQAQEPPTPGIVTGLTGNTKRPFPRVPERPNSVHKPPLNTTPDLDSQSEATSPNSPTSSQSMYTNALDGTEGGPGYLHQQSFPVTLHRRRPTTTDIGDATTLGMSDLPPPSYQASIGASGSSSGHGTGTYMGGQR